MNFAQPGHKNFSFVDVQARAYRSTRLFTKPLGAANMKIRKTTLKLVFATTCVLGTAALAEEPKYTMAVISDQSYGKKVIAGDYDSAIELVTSKKQRGANVFPASMNLCVAYTKKGELDMAEQACETAVTEARANVARKRRNALGSTYGTVAPLRDLALALSNRGVLRAAQGETDRARADFSEAVSLDTGLDAPEINLARLGARR